MKATYDYTRGLFFILWVLWPYHMTLTHWGQSCEGQTNMRRERLHSSNSSLFESQGYHAKIDVISEHHHSIHNLLLRKRLL